MPGVQALLQLAVGGVVEEGGGRGLRGVEAGPEGGVGEPSVGVLEPLGALLGGARGFGGVAEQRGPALQLGGPRGDAAGGASGLGQLRFQRGLLAVQALPAGQPGGRADLGPAAVGEPPLALLLGGAQFLLCRVQRGGVPACPFEQRLQFLRLLGELRGGCVARLGGGGGQGLAYGAEAALVLGAMFVGGLVGGQGALLRLAVDVSGDLARGCGVFGGAADGAGLAVVEVRGEFGGDAVEPPFLQPQPLLLGAQGALGGGERAPPCLLGGPGQLVPRPGGGEPLPRGFAPYGELLGPPGGLLGGVDPGKQFRPGGFPPGEPVLGVSQYVVVGALLPVHLGAFGDDLGQALLGAAGRLEAAQLLGGPAGGGGEPGRAGVGEVLREQRTRACLGGGRSAVLGIGGLAQFEGRRHRLGLAPPLHPCPRLPVGVGPLLQARGALLRLGEPPLQPGHFAYPAQGPLGGGVGGLGGREPAVGDGHLLTGGAAGDGGRGQDGLRQSGVARREFRQFHGLARRLLHAVGIGQQRGVALAHLRLGGPSAFGEALFDLGETTGVEQTAEQFAAGLGVGAQEAREVALRQQHDLAELFAAHPEQLRDLLADLLVGAAEVLPGAGCRVVLAQPALGLVERRARAALLRAFPGRLPGDLQPASGDGEVEGDLGAGARGGVVAAQGRSLPALPGAGHRAVQGVAHGVQDGGLAGAGRTVQQEQSGGRQRVEVDRLGAAEGPEGGEVEPVQPHRATSRTASSARTASNASRSTVRSRSSGSAPRTWATKSSAICWSSRPARRRA